MSTIRSLQSRSVENYNGKIKSNNTHKGDKEMTKEELKQVDEMVLEIMAHLNDMLTDKDCEHYIKLTAENATVFFTALNNAVCATLSRFTDDCINYIDAQHIFNKLLIQYLIDSNMYEGKNNQRPNR